MRFVVDANLPPALAAFLVERGHTASHVADTGEASRSDSSIWAEAARSGAVIVTKDEDFARRRSLVVTGPQIVWVRLPNTRRAALLAYFGASLAVIESALARGEPLIEIA